MAPTLFPRYRPVTAPWPCPRCPPMDAVGSVRAAWARAAIAGACTASCFFPCTEPSAVHSSSSRAFTTGALFPRVNVRGRWGGQLRRVRLSPGKWPLASYCEAHLPPLRTTDLGGNRKCVCWFLPPSSWHSAANTPCFLTDESTGSFFCAHGGSLSPVPDTAPESLGISW